MQREAEVTRKTLETEVYVKLNIDGSGTAKADTRIGFFDHMLVLLAKHALMDVEVVANGDLEVDSHHTIEDTGIVLGQAISKALGSKESIARYGTAFVPMDEALVMVSMDLSSRPYLHFEVDFSTQKLGDMDTEMVEEFFRAISVHGGITLHIKLVHGKNNHHIAEAIFKAFGQALRKACETDNRIKGVLSTKGTF
ncbi:MAG: imidazoleglycerol-phosphate dehydratase HisB [Clostridiaceae bacterium]|nr:imidazoleglycerol-phosphate dehydratase HisB [Clostridiaceae bacterium]